MLNQQIIKYIEEHIFRMIIKHKKKIIKIDAL